MAKDTQKLRVLTPQTTDGKTLLYDENEKVVYKETIVELSAKKDFESLNNKLPKHLQHKLEVIDASKEKKSAAKDPADKTDKDKTDKDKV